MQTLFLTSSVHAVAQDIAKRLNLTVNNKLVFITTAAEPVTGDMSWRANDRKALVDAGFEVSDYTITAKTLNQLKNDLSPFDYIYMSGGNTPYLLNQSKKSGFITLIKDLVKDGKTYIGTSGGSIAAGPKCPDYLLDDADIHGDIENQKGYGFVNFTILPHWGREDFKERYLNERLETAYKSTQVPLILLTDNQYVYVVDDRFEIVEVKG